MTLRWTGHAFGGTGISLKALYAGIDALTHYLIKSSLELCNNKQLPSVTKTAHALSKITTHPSEARTYA